MEIQQVGAELLGVLKTNLVAGVEFAKQQFPDLCSQIITKGLVLNILGLVISVVMFIISIAVFSIARSELKEAGSDDWMDTNPILIILMLVSVGMGIVFLFESASELLTILLAPKIFLLDYFRISSHPLP